MKNLDIYLLIGPSSSGKTNLAKQITDSHKQKTLAVNDRDGDSPFNEKLPWTELENLKDSAVVVEDLISLSKQQLDQLKYLLNYKGHHDNVNPIVLITHSIVANGMSQLLPYITRLIFSASPNCLSSIKRALSYYGFSKEEIDEHLVKFKDRLRPFLFFELGIISRDFSVFSLGGAKMKPENENENESDWKRIASETSQNLFRHLLDPPMAQTIFDMLIPHIKEKSFNHHDLSVAMVSKKSKRLLKISLVDYIDSLIDNTKIPSKDLLSFHFYMKKRVLIPESFIKNKKYVQ